MTPSADSPRRPRHLIAAIAAGTGAALVLAVIGFGTFHLAWPAYAAAAPHKAYTLPMLIARLTLGVIGSGAGGAVAARIAPDDRRASWLTGAFFVAVSIPDHLYPGFVWNDYPVWYHAVYLSYLVPVAGVGGMLSRRGARPTAQSL